MRGTRSRFILFKLQTVNTLSLYVKYMYVIRYIIKPCLRICSTYSSLLIRQELVTNKTDANDRLTLCVSRKNVPAKYKIL